MEMNTKELKQALLEAKKEERRLKGGNLSGYFAIMFALLGIFTLGIVFIPIAILLTIAGTIVALTVRNSVGIAIHFISWILIVIGVMTSPLLMGTVGQYYIADKTSFENNITIDTSNQWVSDITISPIDDSEIVKLSLTATNNKSWISLECKEGKTSMWIIEDLPLFTIDRSSTALLRFGKNKAERVTYYSIDPKIFIKKLLNNKSNKFIYKQTASEPSIFNTKGIEEVIKPLRKSCNW